MRHAEQDALAGGFFKGFGTKQKQFNSSDLDELRSVLNREVRRVSTTLRHMLTEFSEFFHVSWTGLLIHASVGTAGGLGALRTKRSG
jgi:hypothetical protein